MPTLFIGDLHIDKLNHRLPNFTNLVIKTLSDTIDIGLKRGIDRVILCGDIYDGPFPRQSTQVKFLSCLAKKDVQFDILLGNHDSSNTNEHSLETAKWVGKQRLSNIRVITKPTTVKTEEGDDLWLLPHPYVEDLPKKYLLGVGHFAVNGARSDNGFKVRSKHCPKGRWILGDFHEPQGGRVNSCKYTYVGSLSQLGILEKPNKRVLLLEDGELSSLKVPLSYTLKRAEVHTLDDLPDVSDRTVYWQIKYASNFKFPAGWLFENTNIIQTSPIMVRKDKRANVLLEDSEYRIDPLKSLEPYLRTRKYQEKVIQRAIKIAHKLRTSSM